MNQDANLPLILTVDDDPVLSVHVSSSLKKNYRVYSVHSALDALSFLEGNEVDLIILDVCMPGMNGLELNNVLQKKLNTQNIPVIFLTGVEDDETLSQVIKSGANDYLTKPISPAELQMHVSNQLKLNLARRKKLTAKSNTDGV